MQGIVHHGSLSRRDIEEILWYKLSDLHDTDKKKKIKITNIISALRDKNAIQNSGSDKKSNWILVEKNKEY